MVLHILHNDVSCMPERSLTVEVIHHRWGSWELADLTRRNVREADVRKAFEALFQDFLIDVSIVGMQVVWQLTFEGWLEAVALEKRRKSIGW